MSPEPAVSGRAAWMMALAALEDAVIEVERALDDPGAPEPELRHWHPPAGLGPLPADLAGHAAELHRAQLRAAARLVTARAETARHLEALDAVPPGEPRPGLLDVTL